MKHAKRITSKAYSKLIETGIFYALVLGSLVPGKTFATQHGNQAIPPDDKGPGGGAQDAKGDSQPETLFEQDGIFQTITNVLLFLIGAIAVIMLIVGGFQYVISGGDSTKVESAKNTIMYAIIGLVVAILAFAAVDFVIDQLETP